MRRHLICLGTSHTGTPLERGVIALAWGLRQFDQSAPVAALLAARSAGIKDLRHGSLHQRDWHGSDPDALHPGCTPHPYQPPATVRHSNLAATLSNVWTYRTAMSTLDVARKLKRRLPPTDQAGNESFPVAQRLRQPAPASSVL